MAEDGAKRATVYFEPALHKALRLKAAHTHRSISAFLEGYRNGLSGVLVWPEEDRDAQRLIALFQIEKALYEVRYEVNNRPNWIGIPVRGLMRLVT